MLKKGVMLNFYKIIYPFLIIFNLFHVFNLNVGNILFLNSVFYFQ